MKYWFLFLLLIICTSGCDLTDSHEIDMESVYYPSVYYQLSNDEIAQRQIEFELLNNHSICSTIDPFGFCEAKIILDYEYNRGEMPFLLPSIDETIISQSKEIILLNEEFTGISNAELLTVYQISKTYGYEINGGSPSDSSIAQMKIRYNNQVYNGLEVLDTEIASFSDRKGVYRLHGNWYKGIYIPINDKVIIQTAKENLVGYRIDYQCWVSSSHTLTAGNILDDYRKVILPVKYADRIELRVAWEIGVSNNEEEYPSWRFYIDVISGEILKILQLFVC